MGNCCRRRPSQDQDQDKESQRPNRGETEDDPEDYNEDDERDDYRYSIGHPAYLEYLEHLHEEEPWNEE